SSKISFVIAIGSSLLVSTFIGSFRPNNDTGFMAIYTLELTLPVLMRYKIIFFLIASVSVPSMAVFKSVFIDPFMIIYKYPLLNITQFLLFLIICQILSLAWVMVHKRIIFDQPWSKYISSLEINRHQNFLVELLMLVIINIPIWVPFLIASVLVSNIPNDFSLKVLNYFKAVYFIELILFVQMAYSRFKLIPLVILTNIITAIGLCYLATMGQLIILIFQIVFMGVGMFYVRPQHLSRARQIKGTIAEKLIYNKFYPALVITAKLIKNNISQFGLMSFVAICLLTSSILLLTITVDQVTIAKIAVAILFAVSLCASNVFNKLSIFFSQLDSYLLSLPVNNRSLFGSWFIVSIIPLAVFFIIVLLYSVAMSYYLVAYELAKSFILCILLLAINFYPQIKYQRQGIFISSIFMAIFLYIEYSYVFLLGG
ncbi:MAG: hypothetical protein WAW86_04120, partial [Gammaproteobacteria bacterium]